jgi:hypothetical protein
MKSTRACVVMTTVSNPARRKMEPPQQVSYCLSMILSENRYTLFRIML